MATATWMAWRRHTAWRQFPVMKITAAECICWAYACPHLPFMPRQLPCCIALRVYSWTPQPRCVLHWHVVPLLPIKGPVSTYTKVELAVQRVEVTQSYNALMQATKHSPLMLGCTAELRVLTPGKRCRPSAHRHPAIGGDRHPTGRRHSPCGYNAIHMGTAMRPQTVHKQCLLCLYRNACSSPAT